MFFIAILCVINYWIKPTATIMFLGFGALTLGFGSLLAGFSIMDNQNNPNIHIYNISACISGFFILLSTLLNNKEKLKYLGPKWAILICYILIMALISVIFYTVYNHPLPFCLTHNTSLTVVDRLFLYIAALLFSISSVLILKNNNIGNLIFHRLYAYGLGLIAIGFFGVSIQTILGDPINWVGGITLYIGTIYIFMALVSSIRIEGKWMLPWEQDTYETGTQYRQMVEAVNEGIMMADTSGIVTFVNNKMVEMLGYSQDELLGTDALFLLEKNQHNIMNKKIENREKGIAESYELKFIRKDGKKLWTLVNASPIYNSKGVHTNNLAMYMDITERKAIEERLLFQADILSRVQDGIIAVDDNFNIIYWNKIAEKMLGWTEEEVIGRNSGDLLQTRFENSSREDFYNKLQKDGHYLGDLYCLCKDKTYLPVEVNVKKFTDKKGKTTSILASIHNISKRKQRDEKLKRTVEELKRSNKELKRFAYVSSHDLQEPLRMVTLYSQLLEKRYKNSLDDDANDFINYIVENAKHMKQLIEDLLEYSKVTSDTKKLGNVDLEKVVDIVISNLSISITENNVNITRESLPTIFADENQMLQVFQNLISNAIKFKGENSSKIHISAKKEEGKWIFAIKDNGIGIKPDYVDQIFEVFKRLHTKEEHPGTGIGLSIVQKIINHHGGQIWVESGPGHGSTFYFTIPLQFKNF